MSFWQCPACTRESYFCDKTHLKLHLISEHSISGRMLSRIVEGILPAFETADDLNNEVLDEKICSESEMKKEGVHQQCEHSQ